MVIINGTKEAAEGKSISEYLSERNYQPAYVAVECNEEIVPKAEYEKRILKDGDVVEVVSFVGGG